MICWELQMTDNQIKMKAFYEELEKLGRFERLKFLQSKLTSAVKDVKSGFKQSTKGGRTPKEVSTSRKAGRFFGDATKKAKDMVSKNTKKVTKTKTKTKDGPVKSQGPVVNTSPQSPTAPKTAPKTKKTNTTKETPKPTTDLPISGTRKRVAVGVGVGAVGGFLGHAAMSGGANQPPPQRPLQNY